MIPQPSNEVPCMLLAVGENMYQNTATLIVGNQNQQIPSVDKHTHIHTNTLCKETKRSSSRYAGKLARVPAHTRARQQEIPLNENEALLVSSTIIQQHSESPAIPL